MLRTCPECALPVSDKALFCPHCGNPFADSPTLPKKRKSSKRARLPNGFGQITEIKNRNLTNPFRAMVTVGVDDNGRPIAKILKPKGYFKTYNDAYMALMEYHKDPRAFADNPSIADIYPTWYKQWSSIPRSYSANRAVIFAWNHIQSIADIPVRSLKQADIRRCIEENAGLAASSQGHIKNLLNFLLDFCVERDIIQTNVSRGLVMRTKKAPAKHHIPFEQWEMDALWGHEGQNIFVDMLLLQCYSGWRPSELLSLRTENITDAYMKGGMKTDAGKDRIVPIHPKVAAIVSRYLDPANEYLFMHNGRKISYDIFRKELGKIISEYHLNTDHSPHDGRVQFISAMKNAGANEYIIKKLVGHTTQDITESVYTNWDINVIKAELEKIK